MKVAVCSRRRGGASLPKILLALVSAWALAASLCVQSAPAAGVTPTVVLGWSPGIGRAVPLRAPITVYFNRPMNPASVQLAWGITPPVAGALGGGPAAFTFRPTTPFRPGVTYHLRITSTAQAVNGLPLSAPFAAAFTAGDGLRVTSFSPAQGTTGVRPAGLLAITFNHPMVPLRGIDVPATNPPGWRVTISPRLPGTGAWLGTSTWVFHPQSGLQPSSRYTVTLAGSARDQWGEPLGRGLRWSFRTLTPEVIGRTPRRDARYVGPRATVSVTFNQPMDHHSVARALTVRTGGAAVHGRINWQGDRLTFRPAERLLPGRVFRVGIAAFARSANHAATLGKAVTWFFTTAPLPMLTTTDPGENGIAYGGQDFRFGVPDVNTTYHAGFLFNTPMNKASLDRRLSVSPPVPNLQTYLSFDGYGNWQYTVGGNLSPSTHYTISLAAGVTDIFGRPLGGAVTLHFKTSRLIPAVVLYGLPGSGSGIAFSAGKVVGAPMQVINIPRLHYQLVRTTLAALQRACCTDLPSPPAGTTVRRWTAVTPDRLNKIENLSVPLAEKNGSPLKPGLYWLGATADFGLPGLPPNQVVPNSAEMVVVNDVNLTLKIGGNESLVWANSTRTGKPLPGLTVKLINYDGVQQVAGQTDNQGVHVFGSRSPSNAMVDDGHHFGLAEYGWSPTTQGPSIPFAYFGFPSFSGQGGTYLYTDRPIYRPGQIVHFHGLLWRDLDGVYARFGPRVARMGANDNLGRTLYRATVRLDRYGAVRGSFRLPSGTPTGTDSIYVNLPHSVGVSTSFTVAEYRKPEFLATVKANQPAFIQGRSLSATAKVMYVFGTPVVHRRVSWVAYRQPRFPQPRGWDSYSFFDWENAWQQGFNFNQPPPSQFGWPVARGHGLTGPHGRLTFRLPINLAHEHFDQTLTVEVTATDLNHQSVSSRVQVPAYRSDLAIGLNPQSQVVAAGKPASVAVAAVKPDGTPRAGQQLTASIVKRTYTSRLVRDQSGRSTWQAVPHDNTLETRSLTTDANGTATVTFTPPSGGEYRVVVQGRDELGNVAETTQTIDASAAESANWGLTSDTSLLLKPDKTTYSVGETAHVLVPAPFADGDALITVERGNIRRYWVQRLPTNSSTVDVPITIDDLPNVYVTVTLFHGPRDGTPAEWRYGVTELHIRVDPRHLIVKVVQSGFRHHPGDPVTYRVTTTDATGRPVSAELSLALVDTAVLALQDELNPDIMQALYAERSLGVSTMSEAVISIDHLKIKPGFFVQGFPSSPGQAGPLSQAAARKLGLPAPNVPATGGGPGAGGNPGITVRSNFADTAYWAGSLLTNRAGKAVIHLRLPDNATTWRLDARGVALNQSVGQAQLHTLATQDLVLRPVLPRFLLEGVSLQVGTILNNNLNRPVQARVSLSSSGLTVGNRTARLLTIPAHGERTALWPATVPVAKAASVTVLAVPLTSGVRGDAVRVRLPVYPPLTDETVATAGQVYGATRQLIILPRGAVPRPGALTVHVSASLVAGLGAAYRDFHASESESNQNVADRVRSAVALRSLPVAITGLKPATYQRLPAEIAAGVQKLLSHQYPDGGWPWFNAPMEMSDPWITADVVQALGASGVRSRAVATAMTRARTFILNALNSPAVYGPPSPALMLALARTGPAPTPFAENLYNNTIRRSRLDAASLADLALTLALAHDMGKARTLAATLDGQAMVSATGAHWETGTQDSWYGPPIAATAAVLAALLAISPHDPFVPAGVRWLMLARQGSDWDCPPDTADALVTLSGYARAAREGYADYRYDIAVDGRERLSGGYAGAAQTGVGRVRVPTAQLRRNGASALVIGRHLADGSFGRGPLYYVAQLKYYLQANAIAPRDEGVSVSRRYLTLQGRPIDRISAGSPLKVQLTIRTTQTLLYLDIQDPLPVGCEPIDSSLNTSQQGLFRTQFWWRPFSQVQDLTWYLSHSDLRDNRVSLYAYYLPPGVYRYTYLAQATVPGRYGVPPTHVQETYFPEVFGRSAGQEFTVR